ncbi:MAG: kinase/pyrophosphorylase, partial [Burkholderiales bacterium]
MPNSTRTAFFISDRTGITAEMLGHALLTQFDTVRFQEVTLPFVDTIEKAREIVTRIKQTAAAEGVRPIVISTLVNTEIAAIVGQANALFLDCFEIFISPLEKELKVPASHAIGRSHS